jgi:D-galacturonate reductase
MYCQGPDAGALISHSDQYRGLKYSYVDGVYAEPSPDYFQYVDLGGKGLTPVGYGYRSVEYIMNKCIEVESADAAARPAMLRQIDDAGIMATPANSSYNERVIEAGRESILNGGREVTI